MEKKNFSLAKELDSATASDSELCKVCMDAIADCVFLDCGHMVCWNPLRLHADSTKSLLLWLDYDLRWA